MKKMMRVLGTLMMAMALLTTAAYAEEDSYGANAAKADDTYTLEEMLEYALEDERLAQAEYEAIMEAFDVTRPFSNIEKAEVTHEAAVIGLYEDRGLEVPAFEGADHVVLPDSLEEIYEIGIIAEINNIAMYEAFLQEDLDDDVRAVFEALKKGSEAHLAAFERAADGAGSGSMARNGQRTPKGNRGGRQGNR